MEPFLDELDAAATLAAAGDAVHARRSAAVGELEIAAHWADLHGDDPQDRPGAVPVWVGGDQLIDYGGDGTPLVQELCLPELATALEIHTSAAGLLVADALDLRHRLPRTWVAVRELACEAWVARKVARMTRRLDLGQAALVDDAVSAVIGTDSPGRVLRAAEGAAIAADPAAHAARVEAALRARYVRLSPTDDQGLRHVIARITPGDALWIDALVARVADILRERRDLTGLPEDAGADELRAEAFGWLARPEELADLLAHPSAQAAAQPSDEPSDEPSDKAEAPRPRRPRRTDAVVHVHLSRSAVDGTLGPVADVDQLGPVILDQVRRLLGHANVRCAGVIDLATTRSVDSYPHPDDVVERTLLRTGGDVFPHSTRCASRSRLDLDHPTPYVPPARGGPPGQTGDHNAAPLTRRVHRAKTHRDFRVQQLGPDEFLWRTPHGLHRLVDPSGTTTIDGSTANHLANGETLQRALDGIEEQLRQRSDGRVIEPEDL